MYLRVKGYQGKFKLNVYRQQNSEVRNECIGSVREQTGNKGPQNKTKVKETRSRSKQERLDTDCMQQRVKGQIIYTKGQCQRQRIQDRVKGYLGKSKFSNMLISRLDRIDTKGIRQRLLWLQIKEVYYQKQRSHARYDLQNRGRVLSPCFSLSSLAWQSLSKS